MTNNHDKKNLLLVEDEVIIAMSEKAELEKYGYTVVIAHSGEEAVELFNEDSDIDLILMDINLGKGIDGTEAASRILKEHDIPIVFLSSHTSPEIVEKTEKITSYGYVVKNSGIVVLDASIKMAFRLHDARMREKEKEKSLMESEDLLNRTGEMARVGGWEVNLKTNEVFWTRATKLIHEVPMDYEPPLNEALSFYPGESGTVLTDAFNRAINEGVDYDLELDFISAKGNKLKVRTIGQSEHVNGQCVRVYGTFHDITESKILENQLMESEERLSLAMDASEHGFWDWNLETNDIYFSPHHYKMLEFEPGYLKNRNESWMDIVHPEDKELVLPEILDNIHKGKPYSVELRMRKGDGSWKWLLSRGKSYEFSSEGKPTRAVGVYLDIDEYKQTEDEKRKIQKRFSAIFENELMCLYIHDLEGNFIDANDSTLRLMGYQHQEIDNLNFASLVAEDQLEKAMEILGDLIRTGKQHTPAEYSLTTKDGGKIIIETIGSLLYENNEPYAIIGIAYDITERKKAEAELKEAYEEIRTSEQFLEMALSSTGSGTWEVVVPDGTVNLKGYDSWEKMLGYVHDDFPEFNLGMWMELIHPEDRESVSTHFMEVLQGTIDIYDIDYRMKHKNANWVWVNARGRVKKRDSDGNALVMYGTHTDITRRKTAEDSLKKAYTEKNALHRELQHRAKNSFNTIESLMSLKSGSLSSNEAREAVEELRSRVHAMAELYTMLYDTDSTGTVDLGEYCKRVATSMEGLTGNISINIDTEPIESDTRNAATIGLIITELVTNASKHAFPDGKKGNIYLELARSDKRTILTVRDDGRGMPLNIEQEKTSTMGLLLVRSLTKQLNAEMKIDTSSGTRFSFLLPELT